MATLRFVTLTGVDQKTSFTRLCALAAEFPFVEWGVLYSPSSAGRENRYPTLEWIERFAVKAQAKGLSIALHLCGSVVKDLLAKAPTCEFTPEDLRILALADKFGRVQLNVRAKPTDESGFRALIEELHRNESRTRVILQWNGHNEAMCTRLDGEAGFEVLFDESGGRGAVRTTQWPGQDGRGPRRIGFAGGLGPDNIAQELIEIEVAAGTRAFTVDMESKLRDASDRFDLNVCSSVLDQAQAFVRNQRRLAGCSYGSRATQVSSLKGRWLDWWVARAIGHNATVVTPPQDACATMLLNRHEGSFERFSPSDDTQLAIKLITKARIGLLPSKNGTWTAFDADNPSRKLPGDTLELAGLRAVVSKCFGRTVPCDIFEIRYQG